MSQGRVRACGRRNFVCSRAHAQVRARPFPLARPCPLCPPFLRRRRRRRRYATSAAETNVRLPSSRRRRMTSARPRALCASLSLFSQSSSQLKPSLSFVHGAPTHNIYVYCKSVVIQRCSVVFAGRGSRPPRFPPACRSRTCRPRCTTVSRRCASLHSARDLATAGHRRCYTPARRPPQRSRCARLPLPSSVPNSCQLDRPCSKTREGGSACAAHTALTLARTLMPSTSNACAAPGLCPLAHEAWARGSPPPSAQRAFRVPPKSLQTLPQVSKPSSSCSPIHNCGKVNIFKQGSAQ